MPSDSTNQSHPYFDIGNDPAYELDCLRGWLPPDLLRRAESRSRALSIGADQVLIRWAAIDETTYLDRLASHLGIRTETLADISRQQSDLKDDQIHRAAEHGLFPFIAGDQLILSIALRQFAARTLCMVAETDPDLISRIRLITAADLEQFLAYHTGNVLGEMATNGLAQQHPAMSAASHAARGEPLWKGIMRWAAVVAAVGLMAPLLSVSQWTELAAIVFILFGSLRLIAGLWPQRQSRLARRRSDRELPVYTVMAALYREAASVDKLVQSLEALDYPREKLDIILVVEANDLQTRAAIIRLGAKPHLRTIIAPPTQPQTKPKALNWALPFARGQFVAVYDAEDVPDPGQLRAAVDAFVAGGDDLACVQASLRIDNLQHTALSRMFAAEYAGQFDALLPGLAAIGSPLPLGGSSNHFRTNVLRKVGAWDAYNVTEDADLGFRLARFGYRSGTIDSETGEEAPFKLEPWIKQRTRWMKGWMQTGCAHLRHPIQFWRDIGPKGFFAFNLIVGGNVLTALVYPWFAIWMAYRLIAGAAYPDDFDVSFGLTTTHILCVAVGYLSTVLIGLRGLARRGRSGEGAILLAAPLYWFCLSAAAYRALFQFFWSRYHWEKTEHGIAKRPPLPEKRPRGIPTLQRRARGSA